nr:probable protein phosphatase 2C 60 [Tanacetum cinerariifolium]
MGLYLSTPNTDKLSQDGENENLRYGASAMQGWRTSMEDAHAAYPDLDCSTSFFGVYDGHGGGSVSKFCAKYLHQQLIKHEAYSSGDLGTAAQKSFLRMDEMMDCMSSQQLVDFVLEQLKTESKLSTVCEKVFDRCLAPASGGEGCDNMTMILVQFKKRPRSVPSASGHSAPDQPSESSGSKDKPEST